MADLVKVQSALNDPARTSCLVYARGRTKMVEQHVPEKVLSEVRANGGKGFFLATFNEAVGVWDIEPEEQSDPNW